MYFEGQKQCFVLYQIYKKQNKNKLNFLVQEEDLGGLSLINSKKGRMWIHVKRTKHKRGHKLW